MKSTMAQARQVQAAESQAAQISENTRLLLLICAKLGIDPLAAPGDETPLEPVSPAEQLEAASNAETVPYAPDGEAPKGKSNKK